MTWTIAFPAPAPMLSTNSRLHWATISSIRHAWRRAMHLHATAAKLPTGLRRVRIDVEMCFPNARKHDANNFHSFVLKPLVDALGPARTQVIRRGPRAGRFVREVGYGLIPDDTAEHLDGPFPHVGKVCRNKATPYGTVAVTITELSTMDGDT